VVNEDALFDAINTVRYNMGRFTPAIRDDGYWVFPSYLGAYDPEAALHRIYGSGPRKPNPPVSPPESVPDNERRDWAFPWLDLLEKALAPLATSNRLMRVCVASSMPGVLVHPNSGAAKSCARSQEDQCVAIK